MGPLFVRLHNQMVHVNVLCVNEDCVKTAPWPASVVIPHPPSHWDETTGSLATTYSYWVVTHTWII